MCMLSKYPMLSVNPGILDKKLAGDLLSLDHQHSQQID